MSPIEEAFEKACRDGVIPGASLLAVDRSGTKYYSPLDRLYTDAYLLGKFRYERTFGKRSMKNDKPFDFDTVMAIASCTKLMTSISALQCVERGLVGLDDDLASVIPELGSKKILTGFDSNQKDFILKENKVPITLR